ncbi:MAG: hypothetical protein RLZZ536_1577, partial [Planctomycetota bacterium]
GLLGADRAGSGCRIHSPIDYPPKISTLHG